MQSLASVMFEDTKECHNYGTYFGFRVIVCKVDGYTHIIKQHSKLREKFDQLFNNKNNKMH
jgi:hypothetical protein